MVRYFQIGHYKKYPPICYACIIFKADYLTICYACIIFILGESVRAYCPKNECELVKPTTKPQKIA